ncbi:nucleobase-ascorbate transporter [Trifolium repens]|nr:nucleobase-ascorbate transporter [Trifolium repens]
MRNVGRAWFETLSGMKLRGACNPANSSNEDYMYHFSENVGFLGSNRIGSRRVIQVSAGFMIFFSMLGKFGALFSSIPFHIFAALFDKFFD